MNIILKIAKAELKTLFYSPIAWVVSIVFFIISSLRFYLILGFYAAQQDYHLETQEGWPGWEQYLSPGMYANIFEPLANLLYLFVPLLTMGIINKEVNSGSIKLLYSSPIKSRHIVIGKFIGLLTFITSFAVSLTLMTIVLLFSVKDAETNIYFSGMLGFYLLVGAYASIGLFISCLTNYQIVAGVLTFVVLFVLEVIGGLWQQYDFVRDVTYFLSISGRAENMSVGLLTTKDIAYFILIIILFISFSCIKLRSIRESRSWKVSLARYFAVSAIVVIAGYLTSRPGYIGYLDVTKNEINTIHPVTRKVLATMNNEPLKVTLYTNLLAAGAESGFPQNRNKYIWKFWDKYVRFHPNIKFEYVYYYDLMDSDTAIFSTRFPNKNIDEIAEEMMIVNGLPRSLFKTPEEIRSIIDLEDEGKLLVMQLEYKGKKTFLRTYPSSNPWPGEANVSGSITRLVNDTVPSILFTTGHYERSPYRHGEADFSRSTLFKLMEDALINLGVDLDTINLAERDIPAATSVLVLADPRSALTDTETTRLRQYLSAGGNAIFYGEPGKQQMLNPILNSLGVNLDSGTVVFINDHEMPNIFVTPVTSAGTHMAGERLLYVNQIYPHRKVNLKMIGSTSISAREHDGFKVEPIFKLTGNDSYWIENGVLVVDSAKPVFSAAEGDLKKADYITGIKMSRMINGKEQRIVITGDADFMSNSRENGQAFKNAAYSWALYNEFPKYTNFPVPTDDRFLINENTGDLLFKLMIYIIPAVVIIIGTIVLVRRSRK